MSKRTWLGLSALLLVPAAGFLLSEVPSRWVPQALDQGVPPPATPTNTERKRGKLKSTRVVSPLVQAEASPTPANDGATAAHRLRQAAGELANRIRWDTQRPFRDPLESANPLYAELRQQILAALREDPSLLPLVLNGFLRRPASLMGTELGAILAELGGPEVEAAMLQAGLDATGRTSERMAALNVLRRTDQISEDTRSALLDSLESQEDLKVTEASLMALGYPDEAEPDGLDVSKRLWPLTEHADEDVRRHAADKIADWAATPEDTALLRNLVHHDAHEDVRISAVMALSNNQFRETESRQLLADYSVDSEQPTYVRRYVLERLQQFPMSESDLAHVKEQLANLEAQIAADEAAEEALGEAATELAAAEEAAAAADKSGRGSP